jgi:hypothetical protein
MDYAIKWLYIYSATMWGFFCMGQSILRGQSMTKGLMSMVLNMMFMPIGLTIAFIKLSMK